MPSLFVFCQPLERPSHPIGNSRRRQRVGCRRESDPEGVQHGQGSAALRGELQESLVLGFGSSLGKMFRETCDFAIELVGGVGECRTICGK